MQTKKKTGSAEWTDPDDAPHLTKEMLDDAEIFEGDTFIQRGRGRPKMVSPKESVNIRLDQDVLALLRRNGPGWQTKVNEMLRVALGLKEK
jgi:uncharacterized protein (DUF4415 family)